MKVIISLFIVTLLVPVSMTGVGSETFAASPSGPKGDLIILMDSLGNEIWGPNVGGTLDHNILLYTNENLISWAMEDQKTGYYPRLAERWNMSEDGLTWDFYLRKGIQWHDGWGEFTAEDVKFTLELVGSPGSTNLYAAQFRSGEKDNIVSYDVLDRYHIRIKARKPDVMFLWRLAAPEGSVSCKKYYETVGHQKAIQHPIGTGPYRFIEHKPAQHIKYEAVGNHWRKTSDFKYITIKAIPEESSRLAMLKGRQADVCIIPPDRVAELKSAGLHIKRIEEAMFVSWVLGGSVLPTRKDYDPACPWVYHQDEPWDSEWNQRALKVRKALSLAINYQAIIDKILYGEGKPTPFHSWAPTGIWFRPEWKPYPYDPGQAKKLLAEAGYSKGFNKPIIMHIISFPHFPEATKVAEAICNDWEAIGIEVTRRMSEWPLFRAALSGRKSAWQTAISAWTVAHEPWVHPFNIYPSKNAYNGGFESLELDGLIEKCTSTLDFDKRVKATHELANFLYKYCIDHGIAIRNVPVALSSKVKSYKIRQNRAYLLDIEYISRAE